MSSIVLPLKPDTVARPDDSPTDIRDRVLRGLYETVPGLGLEDILELRVIIDPPAVDQSPTNQAREVLDAVQQELQTWPDPPAIITEAEPYE